MGLMGLMNNLRITGKVNLALILAGAGVLLALFISNSQLESLYTDSSKVMLAQVKAIEAQTGSADHESHLHKLTGLLEIQNTEIAHESRLVLISTVLSCALVGLLMWLFLRQQLLKPLRQLAVVAERIPSDESTTIIPDFLRTDEVGILCNALQSFKSQCVSVQELQQSTIRSQQRCDRGILEQAQQEKELASARAKVHELEEELLQAKIILDYEAVLQQRILQLFEYVSAASSGSLIAPDNKLDQVRDKDDYLGRMAAVLQKLFAQFDRDVVLINTGASLVVKSASHLQGLGNIISGNAGGNNDKAKNILSGAKNVRSVLLKISANVEQMECGIQGISGNATQASAVAAHAVELAQNTSGTMRKLAESSVDINNVIKLITSIAEQTNLLALNATIEAARAGDAGKGFAVVANEVKELAKETNKATDEIQRRITTIRTETGNAVEAIGDINKIVSQIDGLQGDISESVRGQSTAVQGIIAMIGDATRDNSTVREILAKMLEVLGTTQATAADVLSLSETLRNDAEGNLKVTSRYVA